MGELLNKNDYRYFAALEDIKEIGAETPPMLHEDTPRSLGIVDAFPESASTGQWVVWNGTADADHIVGDIYVWNGEAWEHKDPTDATAQGMYMTSLSDIMAVVPNVAGRFSTVFTNLLMAQEIIVGKTIKSANFDGTIDSDGHITSPGTAGFAQTHAGEQVMNNAIVRGSLYTDLIELSCEAGNYEVATIANNTGISTRWKCPATGYLNVHVSCRCDRYSGSAKKGSLDRTSPDGSYSYELFEFANDGTSLFYDFLIPVFDGDVIALSFMSSIPESFRYTMAASICCNERNKFIGYISQPYE